MKMMKSRVAKRRHSRWIKLLNRYWQSTNAKDMAKLFRAEELFLSPRCWNAFVSTEFRVDIHGVLD